MEGRINGLDLFSGIGGNTLALRPSRIVKQAPTLNLFLYHELRKGLSSPRPYGMTFERLLDLCLAPPLILLSLAFPARISALQAMVQAWQASDLDWCLKYSGSSQKYAPGSFSLKTCRRLGHVAANEWGKNWPRSGMIVGGICYPLLTWGRRTKEKDGFCWVTPTARGREENYETYLARMQGKTDPKSKGKTRPTSLGMQVNCPEFFPTPSASSYGTNQGGGAGRVGKVRPSLETMAKRNLWPTPTTGDWKSGSHGNQGNARPLSEKVGGSLNPTWVEWLMGFPIGWSELNASVTQWYRPKREKRSKD